MRLRPWLPLSLLLHVLLVLVVQCPSSRAHLEAPPERALFTAMPPSTCSGDNWGMPHQTSRPVAHPGYFDTHIRDPCVQQMSDKAGAMSALLPNATVIHSKSTAAYDDFVSSDWVPENRHLYGSTSSWGNPKKFTFDAVEPYSMRAATCTAPTPDPRTGEQSQWTVTRIGPMRTHGGYDWVQIGWDDVWGMRAILDQHPDGVFVMEQYMSPVFANGTRIEYPPIHIHHMHMGPSPYVRQRFDPIECLLKNTNCFDPSRTFETHGDYTCPNDQGGMDCRVESMPEGYAQLVTVPLGIEGELNDVRAPGSPELEWYWEVGARWMPKNAKTAAEADSTKGYRPLSLHNYGGPGNYDMNVQKSLLFTFNIPTKYDSVFWYTGRMPIGGDLRRMKIHSHNNMFEQSLVFAASPADLGMTESEGWSRDDPQKALHPRELGFAGVDDVLEYTLNHLADSQRIYDAVVARSSRQPAARPQIVCQSHYMLEVQKSMGYDRKCSTCCAPWTWEDGQVFTVLAINVHHKHPVGLQSPRLEDLPDFLTGHVGYWLFYDSQQSPPRSNWMYNMYNHDPDGYTGALDMPAYQKVAMIINKHTSPSWHDWRSTPNSLLGMVVVWIAKHMIMGAVTFVLLAFVVYRLAKRVPRLLRSDYKKNDDCLYSHNHDDEYETELTASAADRQWRDTAETEAFLGQHRTQFGSLLR